MKLLDIILEDESKEKLIKKVKTIYKGLKRGVIHKGHFGKIVYELPDDYDLQIDINDDPFIKLGNNKSDNAVRFYFVDNTSGEYRPYELTNYEYKMYIKRLEDHKFKAFDIILWFEHHEDSKPLNEEDDKSKKKVKAVFKALNKKVCRKNDKYTFYFVLPDRYDVIETDTPEIEEYRRSRQKEDDFTYVQVGHDSGLNSIKFFYKAHGDDKLNKLGMDTADTYDYYLFFVNRKFKPFNIKLIYKTRTGKWK